MSRFATDIYLSVAPAEDPAWVASFRTMLAAMSRSILGRPLVIKPDESDATSDMGALVGSAVFLAVLSPEYLAAESCTSELTMFDTTANALSGAFGAAGNRIFTAVKATVPASDTPEPLGGLWSNDLSSVEDPAQAEWITRLTKLSMDLCDTVGKLQGGEATESAARAEPVEEIAAGAPDPAGAVDPASDVLPESKPEAPPAVTLAPLERTVFLAETTEDVGEFRDGVRWELEHQGYTVLPERNLPREEEGLRSEVTAAVGRSGLVVQLVGAGYGEVPDWDPDRSVVALQSDVIDELLSARPRPWIIWVSPQAEATTNTRQRGFVEALTREAVADRNTQVLHTPFERLKTEIGEALVKLGTARPAPPDGRLMIYLICDEKDRRAVKPVWDALRGRDFNVGTPAFDHHDPLEKRKEHERLLLGCDASIVFYRNASHGWYNEKVMDWRQMIAWENDAVPEPKRTKLANAVLLIPPLSPEKRQVDHDLLIKQPDAFDPGALERFFETIHRNKVEA